MAELSLAKGGIFPVHFIVFLGLRKVLDFDKFAIVLFFSFLTMYQKEYSPNAKQGAAKNNATTMTIASRIAF